MAADDRGSGRRRATPRAAAPPGRRPGRRTAPRPSPEPSGRVRAPDRTGPADRGLTHSCRRRVTEPAPTPTACAAMPLRSASTAAFDLVALEAARPRPLAGGRRGRARSARLREDGEPWIFYEGPPTANGRPGLHHVWARVFKDLYPRFQTMRGRAVPRKGGWDCHGLPVELEVEKELGLTSKHEIEDYGVAEFNQRCRESVHRYVEDWSSLTERSGTWIDTDDAYWTLSNDYVESVWWLVRQMWDKGLLYEGHRVTPYCPRCGTALSLPRDGPARRVPGRHRPVGLRPLPAAREPVGPARRPAGLDHHAVDADLQRGRRRRPRHRLRAGPPSPTAATSSWPRPPPSGCSARTPPYDVVWRGTGRDLVGRRYQRPFAFLDLRGDEAERAERVVAADYVTTDDGSGIVHLAPAFGEEDAAIGRAEGLPVLNPVDADGRFDEPGRARSPACGVKEADAAIIDDLATGACSCGSSPTCTATPTAGGAARRSSTGPRRRGSPARPTGGTTLLRENERIGWHPEHIKHGRFGKWLESNVDWALSRDRYWGTPLPVWRCEERPRHLRRLGGRAGRRWPAATSPTSTCTGPTSTRSPSPARRRLRRRRPAACPRCSTPGSTRARCRRPSTTSRSSTAGRRLEPPAFPADFICEAIDQTRGWFYSLLAVNTLVFDATPVPQRRVPRPHRRRRGPEDVEVARATSSTRGTSSTPTAPTPCAGTSSRPASRGRRAGCSRTASGSRPARRCSRSGTSSPSSPPTPTSTAGSPPAPDAARAADPRPRPVGARRARRHRRRGHRRARGFDALGAATRLGPLRRRPLELVRPPLPAPLLEGSDPAAHATLHRCLVHRGRAAGPVLPRSWPTSSGRSPHRRRLGARRRLAGAARLPGRGPGRPRWPPPAGSWPSAGPPAPTPRSRCASRCAGPCCCTPARRSTTAVRARDRRGAERQGASRTSRTLGGLVSLDGGAQLPGPRPPPRARR